MSTATSSITQTRGTGSGTGTADYWQTLYNVCRRRVRNTCLEDKDDQGVSIWVATVMYTQDNGVILSWTKQAPEKRAAREAAALEALRALNIPIN